HSKDRWSRRESPIDCDSTVPVAYDPERLTRSTQEQLVRALFPMLPASLHAPPRRSGLGVRLYRSNSNATPRPAACWLRRFAIGATDRSRPTVPRSDRPGSRGAGSPLDDGVSPAGGKAR